MKFKAAILTEIGKPLTISNVETKDLKVGQVLVKILMSGLCGAQLQEISGLKGNSKFLPHLMGHEGCGIVEEIGLGVTKVKIGDKVVLHWRKGEGIESDFPSYIYDGKEISSGKVTTLSEYSVISENRLTVVPKDTPNELCALLGCGLSTALGIINNDANLKFGESILIIGCGGVGLNLIQGANLASAYPIIGMDISEDKREMAMKLNATSFINSLNDNIENELEKLNIKKIDIIVDTSGNVDIVNRTIDFLSDSGKYILVAQSKPGDILKINNPSNLFLGDGKIIKATQGGQTSPSQDIPRYIRLYKSGKFNISNIITHKFDLLEINSAIDLLRSGHAGRIMINTNNNI